MRSHNRLNNNAWKIYSQRWLNFSNSSSVQKLDRFLEELDELVETVSQEHETAEEILNNASRVRTRIIVLSLSL